MAQPKILVSMVPPLESGICGDWYARRHEPELQKRIPHDAIAAELCVYDEIRPKLPLEGGVRSILVSVLEAVLDEHEGAVIRLAGSFLNRGIAGVYKHVGETRSPAASRFVFWTVRNLVEGPGYSSAVITAEFGREWLTALLSDSSISVENQVSIQGVLVSRTNLNAVLQDIELLDTEKIVGLWDRVCLYVVSLSHGVGLGLLTKRDRWGSYYQKLQRKFGEAIKCKGNV